MKRTLIYYATVILTISISLLLSYTLKTDRLYTHFFYIPIVLTALWYPRFTIPTSFGFAFLHFVIEWMIHKEIGLSIILRGLIIVLVAFILSEIWKKEIKYQTKIAALSYSNNHDFLTGVYNRAYFDSVLHGNTKYPMAIFICDIDNLKFVNDTYGHRMGDQLIKKTSVLLTDCFGKTATVARLGGDEFGVLLPECGMFQAEEIFNTVYDALKLNNVHTNDEYELSFSVGYSISDSLANSIKTLKEADDKMYAAKESKKRTLQGMAP